MPEPTDTPGDQPPTPGDPPEPAPFDQEQDDIDALLDEDDELDDGNGHVPEPPPGDIDLEELLGSDDELTVADLVGDGDGGDPPEPEPTAVAAVIVYDHAEPAIPDLGEDNDDEFDIAVDRFIDESLSLAQQVSELGERS